MLAPSDRYLIQRFPRAGALRARSRSLSIVAQWRDRYVIVTENPKTIGDSTAARYSPTGTLVDPILVFFFFLSHKLQKSYLNHRSKRVRSDRINVTLALNDT